MKFMWTIIFITCIFVIKSAAIAARQKSITKRIHKMCKFTTNRAIWLFDWTLLTDAICSRKWSKPSWNVSASWCGSRWVTFLQWKHQSPFIINSALVKTSLAVGLFQCLRSRTKQVSMRYLYYDESWLLHIISYMNS